MIDDYTNREASARKITENLYVLASKYATPRKIDRDLEEYNKAYKAMYNRDVISLMNPILLTSAFHADYTQLINLMLEYLDTLACGSVENLLKFLGKAYGISSSIIAIKNHDYTARSTGDYDFVMNHYLLSKVTPDNFPHITGFNFLNKVSVFNKQQEYTDFIMKPIPDSSISYLENPGDMYDETNYGDKAEVIGIASITDKNR